MISELQIFTRLNNNFELPSKNWRLQDEIYVAGKINLGLYDELIFDQNNAPTLRKVIKLINLFKTSSNVRIELKSKNKDIEIVKVKYNEIEIFQIRGKDKTLLLKKTGHFALGLDTMEAAIYKQIQCLNRELRYYYCQYIRPINTNYKFDFCVGDLIKTKEVPTIKNYREGIIFAREYHKKDNVNYYYIRIDGKIHNRRYKMEEIALNE